MCKYGSTIIDLGWPSKCRDTMSKVRYGHWSCSDLNHALSPFQSMTTSYVAKNTISVKNWTEVVRLMTSCFRGLTWSNQYFAIGCAKDAPFAMQLHNYSAIAKRFTALSENSWGFASPPVPARVNAHNQWHLSLRQRCFGHVRSAPLADHLESLADLTITK